MNKLNKFISLNFNKIITFISKKSDLKRINIKEKMYNYHKIFEKITKM